MGSIMLFLLLLSEDCFTSTFLIGMNFGRTKDLADAGTKNAFEFESTIYVLVSIYFTKQWLSSLDYWIELNMSTWIAMIKYCFHDGTFLVFIFIGFRVSKNSSHQLKSKIDQKRWRKRVTDLQVETGSCKNNH